jgi:hypothetical protein
MSTFSAFKTWVCLGDSLTHNPPSSPTTVLNPWPGRIDLEIWPDRGAANHGHTGTRLATDNVNGVSMRSHFDSDIDGRGYYGMVLWGGVNDVLADADGADIYDDYKALVDDALAQGMKVIAVITSPSAGYTGGWSSNRQTALETFRSLVLSNLASGYSDDLAVVDLYDLMGDPDAPTFLDERWKGVADDGLHHGEDGHTQRVIPALLPLMEAPSTSTQHSGASADLTLKHGDLLPVFRRKLRDERGFPLDLTGTSVTFRLRAEDGDTLKVNASASIVDAEKGIVEYRWAGSDTDTLGRYSAEFVLDGPRTLPPRGFYTIEVVNSLADGLS